MRKAKTRAAFDVESDQLAWLQQMAGDYKLPDISKALRIVIDRADCGRRRGRHLHTNPLPPLRVRGCVRAVL